MKCEIISDLLPLYVDGIASEQSKVEIEEHLKTCSKCNAELTKMKQPPKISLPKADINMVSALKKAKSKFFRKNVIVALTSVAVVIALLISTYAFVLTPQTPIPYGEGKLTVETNVASYILRDDDTPMLITSQNQPSATDEVIESKVIDVWWNGVKTTNRSWTACNVEENGTKTRYIFLNFTKNIISEWESVNNSQSFSIRILEPFQDEQYFDENGNRIFEIPYDKIKVYYIDKMIKDVDAKIDYKTLVKNGTLVWSGSLK